MVIARNSTFKVKDEGLAATEIAKKIGARYIVEGSVSRAGGRVRIAAQLIDATSDLYLWADRFDRELGDIFAVQDEVTRTIAATLGVRLQDAATERALKKNTSDLDAYDCLLRARRFTSTLNETMHREARDLLERAVQLDAGYGDAYALLANVYLAEHRFELNALPAHWTGPWRRLKRRRNLTLKMPMHVVGSLLSIFSGVRMLNSNPKPRER